MKWLWLILIVIIVVILAFILWRRTQPGSNTSGQRRDGGTGQNPDSGPATVPPVGGMQSGGAMSTGGAVAPMPANAASPSPARSDDPTAADTPASPVEAGADPGRKAEADRLANEPGASGAEPEAITGEDFAAAGQGPPANSTGSTRTPDSDQGSHPAGGTTDDVSAATADAPAAEESWDEAPEAPATEQPAGSAATGQHSDPGYQAGDGAQAWAETPPSDERSSELQQSQFDTQSYHQDAGRQPTTGQPGPDTAGQQIDRSVETEVGELEDERRPRPEDDQPAG